jgi:hypothetical protein
MISVEGEGALVALFLGLLATKPELQWWAMPLA